VYGLYSSFIPVILYSIFGSSRHISVGTFPVVALMVGNAVTRLSSASSVCDDSGNSTTTGNTSSNASSSATSQEESDPCFQNSCETLAVDVAVTLSFLVGVIMVKENSQ
jgi:MFS superfamily sulfate permease-like transporter